jgi:hypothetical protein
MLLNGAAQIVESAMQFPQYALLHSVTYVQLRLITILGSCGWQFPWCALAPKVLTTCIPFNLFHPRIILHDMGHIKD